MAFNEIWYSDEQLRILCELAQRTLSLTGEVFDIGCWEGLSTVTLANFFYPLEIHAVDHWMGCLGEGEGHHTVQMAKTRDVFAEFAKNIAELTKGNVKVLNGDFAAAFESKPQIKFAKIDVSHDFQTTNMVIELVKDLVVSGGIIYGKDFGTANMNRIDLDGGVERAVRENFGTDFIYLDNGNIWVYFKR